MNFQTVSGILGSKLKTLFLQKEFNVKKFIALATMLIISLTMVACGKKKEEQAAQAAVNKTTGSALLTYVPADSPYVYAALEPSPKAVHEKMKPLLDATIPAVRNSLESVAGVMEMADEDDTTSPEERARRKKMLDAIIKRLTPDIGKRFGFSAAESVAVFYGHGMLPVARVVLADPEQFRKEFAVMTAEMEVEFEQVSIESITYDSLPIGEAAQLLVAQDGDMLVVAIAPPGFSEENIAILLGAEKPAESLAGSPALQALADKHSYLPQGLGWIDMQSLVGDFVDGPSGLTKAVIEMAGEGAELPTLSDVCKEEVRGLAAIAPRLTIGYTKLDTSGFDMLPVMELRDDVAKGLMPTAGKVPGMTSPGNGLLKFGMAIDLKAMREYAEVQIKAISEQPFECPELTQINMAAAQMQQGLQQPVPPIVYNFKGFFIDVNNFDGIDFANPALPKELDLSILLAFDNVNALMQMGQMMLPPLAAIELQPDGEAVAIPQEMLAGYAGEVFAAMGDNLLAIGSGDGSDARVSELVKTKDSGEAVFMAMSVDLEDYTRLMNEMQAKMLKTMNEGGEADDEAKKALALVESSLESNRELQEVYGELFDRETFKIIITEKGFELPTSITFQ